LLKWPEREGLRMSKKSRVEQFFAVVEESMRLKFRGWEKDLPHQGEKGGIRERRVTDFLSSVLPERYGIGSGHIVGPQEPFISFQTDIVIYDAQDGAALPFDDYYSLFPCECVYAAIEVKSKLEANDGDKRIETSIYQCLERTTRLKELKPSGPSRIHSIVFAYETDWAEGNKEEKVKYWFEFLGEKYSLKLPEVVFVLDPGFVLTAAGPSGYNEDSKLPVLYPRAPLLFFVSDLMHRLSETKVTPVNLRSYKEWYPGDLQARIWQASGWQDIYPLQLKRVR
jgi:hypothetical protein